ncbi:MAG: hypothetical protein GY842_05160 [bacterium]|nr:hypothetical protein [bacterium]
MVENKGTVPGERSQRKELVLTGAPNSEHQQELIRTIETVYARMKSDKSNVSVRRRFRDGSANCPAHGEVKSPGIAEVLIAFAGSGAAVAAINVIASVIARSKTTMLTVCLGGKVIGSIEGKGFADSAQVEALAAQMIKSDVELQLHAR